MKDDQAPDSGWIRVGVAVPWTSVPFYVQRFTISPALPNKNYVISLVPQGGGPTLQKSGS